MDTYEKKYKEALEKAKDYHKQLLNEDNPEWASEIEKIFPELKESEDERIRKAIICGMHALKDQKKTCFASIPIDDVIAWLEKQGEQKPAWSEEDEAHINGIIDYLLDYKLLVYEEDMNVANGVQKELDWLKSLKQRIGE